MSRATRPTQAAANARPSQAGVSEISYDNRETTHAMTDFNLDLHTGANDDQFGHLEKVEEEETKSWNMQFKAVPSDQESSDDDESGDSGAGPTRWQEPTSLEMDCIFLEDETTKEDTALPQIFDMDMVMQLESRFCMLCSETFGNFRLIFKHNCKRCGKAVCENCSKQQRRLCQIDPKKHRICDECDAVMANHLLEKMFEREVQNKKSTYEDLKAQLKDSKYARSDSHLMLERAKQQWESKTQETDKKIQLRDVQLKEKIKMAESLKAKVLELRKTLDIKDEEIREGNERQTVILSDINQMKEQRENVVVTLLHQESQIDDQNRLLNFQQEDEHFKRSMVGDMLQEVDFVPSNGWRAKEHSDSDDDTQPAQSYDNGNPLMEVSNEQNFSAWRNQ